MDAVGFYQLSPRLQQIAAWLIEDEAPYNLTYAQHPDPAEYTYELWPEGERIKAVFVGDESIYEEHEEGPGYDLDYGQAEAMKAYADMQAAEEERRFLNRAYNH